MALRRRHGALGLALAMGLGAAVLCPGPMAQASGDPSKPATYAPDEELLTALDAKAAAFKDQVAAADIQLMVTGVQRLIQAVQQHDLNGSRQAWLETHAIWARCEAFSADLFPGLDKKINGWPDVATGFHAIERGLFAAQPSVEMATALQLEQDMETYQRVLAQSKFTGYYLIASASTWAFEMGETMTEGGESPVSGNSLSDFQHNIEGVERVWRMIFADSVRAKKHFLAEAIDDQIAGIKAILEVPSLDQIQAEAFQRETTKLASQLAEASTLLGWRAPNFTDLGE
jgi:iron uptake system EfeUOB component EfeO/EfeM